ncbi:MAG TPA: GNAT family protein [Candidatus Acidoferrales bacterium]|nr:GNAT family protein [Candidatus Acidoferrales bacterium]
MLRLKTNSCLELPLICPEHAGNFFELVERLGFKLEGIIREIERLPDHHADHAIYGLLRVDGPSLT